MFPVTQGRTRRFTWRRDELKSDLYSVVSTTVYRAYIRKVHKHTQSMMELAQKIEKSICFTKKKIKKSQEFKIRITRWT